jgi:hypothetical protein
LSISGNVGIGTSSPASLLSVSGVGTFGSLTSKIKIGLNGDSLSSDGDFYIQTSSANPLIFRTNFAEIMRITSAGNVGIGTTSSDLFARGYGRILNINSASSAAIEINATTGSSSVIDMGVNGTRSLAIITDGSTPKLASVGALPLAFETNSSERMRITSAGLVGLGTSSPGQRLHVEGSISVNTGTSPGTNGSGIAVYASDFPRLSFRNSTTGDTSSDGLQIFMSGADVVYALQETGYQAWNTSSTERMRIDSSGNVGIGTTAPTSTAGFTPTLQLTSAASTALVITKSTTTQQNVVGTDGAGLYIESAGNATGTSNNIIFRNTSTNSSYAASERMRITSAGKVLINTTDTSFSGVLLARSSVIADEAISVWNNTTTGDGLFVKFYTDAGSGRGQISYNRAGGLTVYGTTSDYRAKDIISPVLNSGEIIDSVPVYMGKMKDATQARPMFIAHETPDYAHTGEKDAVDKDGKPIYQQMDASSLVPVLWAEIQSLRKRVAQLESK